MALLSKLSGRSQKNIFCTRQLYNRRHALQWKSCALEHRAIAGFCRQLSNVTALPFVTNLIVARLVTRVQKIAKKKKKVPNPILNKARGFTYTHFPNLNLYFEMPVFVCFFDRWAFL